jgi:DNA-binding MarR family transcriptional regulator/predicted N-acetyltransferase YhbS
MDATINAVRSFNRFYTQHVGALDPRFLGSDITLAEARLLFEIAHAPSPVAADLQAALGMDAGYVSRVIARFEARGWVVRQRGAGDARRRPISLTPAGRDAFAALDQRQREAVAAAVERLRPAQRADLVAALGTVRALLGAVPAEPFAIRPFRTGDVSLIVARQSILYDEEQGWALEANEAEVAAHFLNHFKPGREHCWVAELGGAMAGAVFLTDEGDGLARLRLLHVEPFVRGRGIGDALVRTCIDFAKDVGYDAITLWTHTVLGSARRIYAAHGFVCVETEMHSKFGVPVQGETWRLTLPRRLSAPDCARRKVL